jgi:NADH-quinone oxidoreductase subunit N
MTSDFGMLLPLVAFSLGAVAVLLGDVRGRSGARPLPPLIGAAAAFVAFLAFVFGRPGAAQTGAGGFLTWDALACGAGALLAICAGVTSLLAPDSLKKTDANHPEVYALVLLASAGMTTMVASSNLVAIFLGLEVASLSLYALCAASRVRATSTEAGLKYFLAGSFASGMFVLGIAFIYGATGRFDVAAVGDAVRSGAGIGAAGATLLLVGFGFKLGLAPFHQWAPDVYEGAPTPITGFMATAVKTAGFAAFLRAAINLADAPSMHQALVWLSAATMVVGNLGALAQKSVKRMLAYSSVGHAGYLMLAPISYSPQSTQATEGLLTYLVAYVLTNLLAFGALADLETREGGGMTFDDLRGARWRRPLPVAALIIAVLSLAGAPPTVGFLGKFRLFGAALERGLATGERSYFLLVGLAILTSLVSLGFYLRVIVVASFREPEGDAPATPRFSPGYRAVLALLAGAVIWLGVGPPIFGFGADGILEFAKKAAGA